MDKQAPASIFPDPRLEGVIEQCNRLAWLLGSASEARDNPGTRFRMLILAVYPARAATEIMLEAAMKLELEGFQDADPKKNRNDFEAAHLLGLPHYHLIEKIRIHDFHRFGCKPKAGFFCGGPIKLTANQGEAAIFWPLHGESKKEKIETGKSKVSEQRPLQVNGDKFLDEVSNKYLTLDEILGPYHAAIVPLVTTFKELVERGPPQFR